MTDAQRRLLAAFVREAVAPDLDAVLGELARLRREVRTLERVVGLPGGRPETRERRALVLELRAAGHSERGIAEALHISRSVVQHDLAVQQAPVPALVRGVDGRLVRGPRRVAQGTP